MTVSFSSTVIEDSLNSKIPVILFDRWKRYKHCDSETNPHKKNSAVYYLNTSDGYNLFEDGPKVNSVENRIVIFDSNMRHTGTSCTNESGRLVMNINYFPCKKDQYFTGDYG